MCFSLRLVLVSIIRNDFHFPLLLCVSRAVCQMPTEIIWIDSLATSLIIYDILLGVPEYSGYLCHYKYPIRFGTGLSISIHTATNALFIEGNLVLVTFLRSLSFWSSLSLVVSGTRVCLSLGVTVTSLQTREDFENPSALSMARHGIDVIAVLAAATENKNRIP